MARPQKAWARMVLCGDGNRRKLMPPKTTKELRDFLYARSRIEDRGYETPCRIWVGCKDSCGYGVLRYLGKNRKIQRLSWAAFRGKIKPEFEVCHKCDQPDCFEPSHLFTGTHLKNMTDAKNKKRMVTEMGINHYCCSFTEQQVKDLRIQFSEGLKVTNELALKYEVSSTALRKIRDRKSWKHI